MTGTPDDVQILRRTDHLVAAVVRGPDGIATVRATRSGEWTCSRCPDDFGCYHVNAVRQLMSDSQTEGRRSA